MFDAEGFEMVDLAPGAALVEQFDRLADDAARHVERLTAPFGSQALERDHAGELRQDGGGHGTADADRYGNAISHDGLRRLQRELQS